MIIRTPDQRLRVFVSSTLQELAEERAAAREAITRLRLSPVMFELGARPHPPKELYRAYLDQSHIFIGVYWERYGWVAPDMDISGLEDEYRLSGHKPKLIYIKNPAPNREPRLKELLERIKGDDNASYKSFSTAAELQQLIENDLAIILTERFEMAQAGESAASATPASTAAETRPQRFSNLPAPTTELIGRQNEVQAIADLLLRSDVRLVTLNGPGGIGKTRLAVEAGQRLADHFEDGVCFVPLAQASDPNQVAPAIALALGLREIDAPGLLDRVKEFVRDKCMLLILDNFEQILPAAPLVTDLLTTASKLEIIVTSRAVLHVRGEHEFPVPTLKLPDAHPDPSALAKFEAVQLFMARAQAARPDFAITRENATAVAEICARLDGLPLAIELAAARVKLLTPQAMLARMIDAENKARLLSGGARDLPARQQTLRNTLEWSYGLLEPEEQCLFTRLSVFVGGWTMDAAINVCGFDRDELFVMETLQSLVDQSLVTAVADRAATDRSVHAPYADGSGERFSMLNTIREYAWAQLGARGEGRELQRRHALHFSRCAQQAEPELKSARQREWLDRLEHDNDNMQTALSWLIDNGAAETAVDMSWSLRGYWLISSRTSEGMRWMTAALAQLDVQAPAAAPSQRLARAKALSLAGFLAAWQGTGDWAKVLLNDGLSLGDELANVAVRAQIRATALAGLALVSINEGRLDLARSQFEESARLFREASDTWSMGMVLSGIGRLALLQSDYETAERVTRESQAIAQTLGDNVSASFASQYRALAEMGRGNWAGAEQWLKAALKAAAASNYREGIAYSLDGLARIAIEGRDAARAARLLGAAEAVRETIGVQVWNVDQSTHASLIEKTKSQAGASFDQAWLEGHAMPIQQAVEAALT
jgi:predicted ATPase